MTEVASAYVTLLPSAKGFGKGIDGQISGDVGRSGKAAGQKFSSGMGGVVRSSARSIFAPLLAAGAGVAVGRFLSGAISGASDLAESTNKVSQIFGKADKAVFKFAKHADKAIGQSNNQARDAAATFGVFGKSAGLAGSDLSDFAIEMTGLSSDLASFSNTSPEEAIQAIGAALRGESEPIRRFGVLLDDATLRNRALKLGLIETTKDALTPQNKVLAAQAEILHQTKDAQGDFARTSDGLANQQRILAARLENTKTKIGKALLPVVNQAVHFLNREGIPAFERFADFFAERAVPAIGRFAAKLGPLAHDLLPAIGSALGTAKDVGEKLLPVVTGIVGAFNKLPDGVQKTLLIGAGVAIGAKKVGLLGGSGGKGLLGSLATRAAPLPVFVTNQGFGAGGVPGAGGTPVGGPGGAGSKAPKWLAPFLNPGALLTGATIGSSQGKAVRDLVPNGEDITKAAVALERLAKTTTGAKDLNDALALLDERFAGIAAHNPQKPFRAVEAAAADAGLPIDLLLTQLPLTRKALGDIAPVAERSGQRSAGAFLKLVGVTDLLGGKIDTTKGKAQAFGQVKATATLDVNNQPALAKIAQVNAAVANIGRNLAAGAAAVAQQAAAEAQRNQRNSERVLADAVERGSERGTARGTENRNRGLTSRRR